MAGVSFRGPYLDLSVIPDLKSTGEARQSFLVAHGDTGDQENKRGTSFGVGKRW
jgi:hypothetical protein